ncbi:unnamed protein product, partial [Musa acuminata subsp. burmannicoides]
DLSLSGRFEAVCNYGLYLIFPELSNSRSFTVSSLCECTHRNARKLPDLPVSDLQCFAQCSLSRMWNC